MKEEMPREPQRVRIYPQIKVEPRPLNPPEVVMEKLKEHPLAKGIRAGEFHSWHDTPLDGDLWSGWGRRAQPEARGMTYAAINTVSTAPEPEEVGFPKLATSRFFKIPPGMTREAALKTAPKYGGTREIEHKYEVWIDGAGYLAEEALARQWRPALSLKWEDMKPLPPDLERALDQFLTYAMQCQYFCSDVIGPYIGRIHYAFLEVKSYLAYEVFDYNLHCAMLRKRAMSNGGGMGVPVEGFDAGVIDVSNEASHGLEGQVDRDFTGMVFALDVLFNGLVLDMLRLAEAAAANTFDQGLFRQMIQDNARHVAWGTQRIRYHLDHCPDREEAALKLHALADRMEPEQAAQHLLNPRVLEPLAVLLGGGAEEVTKGYAILREFWPQFAENYVARLDAAGLPRRGRCLIPQQAPF